jgi:cell wall-associated NlpC family hydrolase
MFRVSLFQPSFIRILVIAAIAITTYRCSVIRDLTTDRPKTSKPNESPVPTSEAMRKEMALRNEVVDYAEQFIGIHYLAAGKEPQTGFDCSGFTSFVMGKYNVKLSASAHDQAIQGALKPIESVKPGDLVFYRRSPGAPIFHVSLVVSNDGKSIKVVHSTTSRGVIMEDILASKYWKPYIDSARDVINKGR